TDCTCLSLKHLNTLMNSSCTFIGSTPDLFWYKQEVNSYPKFILRRSRSSADNSPEFVKDRFDAELKDGSVPLMIQDLHVCDSAVYYCLILIYMPYGFAPQYNYFGL
uniref:Immunoglobulin V-set domain-containing protein n=1 Tax=Gouania willdenowi TaxID=441366 RepID=A0A8C5GPY8_GOUWI